jgi:hypothetical protein
MRQLRVALHLGLIGITAVLLIATPRSRYRYKGHALEARFRSETTCGAVTEIVVRVPENRWDVEVENAQLAGLPPTGELERSAREPVAIENGFHLDASVVLASTAGTEAHAGHVADAGPTPETPPQWIYHSCSVTPRDVGTMAIECFGAKKCGGVLIGPL